MTIDELREQFVNKGYYGTTREFQAIITELFNMIENLQEEVADIKYRYKQRDSDELGD